MAASSAASVCTKHSMVAKRGEIMPAPLHWALRRTAPPDSVTSSAARFSYASVVMMARAKSPSPPGRSSCAADSSADTMRDPGSCTPITPVEATATRSSGSPHATAAAPCMRAASSSPRRPVAALAIPEFTATARSASSRQRSLHVSTGAASVALAAKRAALTAFSLSHVSRPTSYSSLRRMEPFTPDARKPPGRPLARSSSRTCAGAVIQREASNERVIAGPSSRAGRTSG